MSALAMAEDDSSVTITKTLPRFIGERVGEQAETARGRREGRIDGGEQRELGLGSSGVNRNR